MKMNFKNILGLSLVIGLSVTGCVNDTFNEPTSECVEPSLVKTKEVQDIYNASTATGVKYTGDDVIEAVITSSDEGGDFFKTLSLMSLDGSRGFSISIDDYNLYTQNLQPGKKVYVKMKGLYTMIPTGGARGLNFGGAPAGTFGTLERIGATEYQKYIIPTCKVIDEETFVKHLTLAQLNNDAYLNALVEVDNVEFASEGVTYGNKPTDPSDKNENITDGITTMVTRTSKYANFAGQIVPSGRGKIRGVLTKFNSTYQLILRTERDVKLTGPRVDYTPPVGGTALTYTGSFTEPFTSYTTTNQQVFPKYINDPVEGSKYWQVKTFGGNKYIQMSSFGGSEKNRTLFIVPVDMTAANNFSFKTLAGYDNGACLRVYYSMNYVPGADANNATLVDITSSFNIPAGPAAAYASTFTSSGVYAIPAALTGNGYFIFEYKGNGASGVTTTMEVDDITVN